MNCQEFKRIIDSYLSDELLVETNHDVLRHLENCPDCRSELAVRRDLRLKIRTAVKDSAEMTIDQAFSRRLTADLRNTALRPTFFEKIANFRTLINGRTLAAASAIILFLTFGTFLWLRNYSTPSIEQDSARHTNRSVSSDSNMAQAIRASWSELAHEAVGDHKNCALEFRLLEKPISLDEAAKKYGEFNKEIGKIVVEALSPAEEDNVEEIELLEAHSCVFAGRRFTHIVLRKNRQVVSVLIADTDLPVGDDHIDTNRFDENINVAGFRADRHAVFVVSELPEAENVSIARQISPAVRRHIEQFGA